MHPRLVEIASRTCGPDPCPAKHVERFGQPRTAHAGGEGDVVGGSLDVVLVQPGVDTTIARN